jgi:hypothetical protein
MPGGGARSAAQARDAAQAGGDTGVRGRGGAGRGGLGDRGCRVGGRCAGGGAGGAGCLAGPERAAGATVPEDVPAGTPGREKPAQAVLRAVDGPHADTRLQVIVLQAELDAAPAAADEDRLRLHAALAAACSDLGAYPQALSHAHQELALRQHLQHPDHPRTLATRSDIAAWTGKCGDATGALSLFTALLPDLERVLGPAHPDTLATRHNIAFWALSLCTALLPDMERVLGPAHSDTLTTRHNLAYWTGECGDAIGALRLFTALLPDQERVLAPTTLTPCPPGTTSRTGRRRSGTPHAMNPVRDC